MYQRSCHHRGLVTSITIIICSLLAFATCFAMDVPIADFAIPADSQRVNDYIPSNTGDNRQNLLTSQFQRQQFKQFYRHYYASDAQGLSPWSKQLVALVLPLMKKIEPQILETFNNQHKAWDAKHYGENFKAHDEVWWHRIKDNMDFSAMHASYYQPENRAISTTNTLARVLPDIAPDFYHASIPGQGFPFDNLQESAIWAGTPLYVLSTSQDHAWSLVLTPDGFFAWVKSNDIAYVSSKFIHRWQIAAQHRLIAVTKTETPVVNLQQQFQFKGYIGAVFPMVKRDDQQTLIYIPVKNTTNHALLKLGIIHTHAASVMPLAASKHNMNTIISQLHNRPYGWGGAFFYNDCSQEMKSIFTPFGIWLPRNSAQQTLVGTTLNLSAHSVDERIHILKEQGRPLMTLIYVGGHVMLYIGNKNDDAITYQNVWGMTPETQDKRYVIGRSVFLPLLKYYPENPALISQANKPIFKLVFLDQLNRITDSPQTYVNTFMGQDEP